MLSLINCCQRIEVYSNSIYGWECNGWILKERNNIQAPLKEIVVHSTIKNNLKLFTCIRCKYWITLAAIVSNLEKYQMEDWPGHHWISLPKMLCLWASDHFSCHPSHSLPTLITPVFWMVLGKIISEWWVSYFAPAANYKPCGISIQITRIRRKYCVSSSFWLGWLLSLVASPEKKKLNHTG